MAGSRELWRRRFCYLALLMVVGHFILASAQTVTTGWWALGVSTCGLRGAPNCPNCRQLQADNVLTNEQREICETMGDTTVQAISQGTRRAIIDCQARFSNWPWNCSTFYGDYLFGRFIHEGTRETACLYAYMIAGSVLGVADACHRRRISGCPCEVESDRQQDEDGNVILHDCNDNVEWALEFIQEFSDLPNTPRTNTSRELMDIHNNEVGRRAVDNRNTSCVCHGISGTCTVMTCYERAPDISAIGEELRQRYDSAIEVRMDRSGGLVPVRNQDPPTPMDLVFTGPRPNFCEPNVTAGILGTQDRVCDPDSLGPGSCALLCCGRGHYSRTFVVPVEQCRFVWCCQIECSVVRNDTIVETRCN